MILEGFYSGPPLADRGERPCLDSMSKLYLAALIIAVSAGTAPGQTPKGEELPLPIRSPQSLSPNAPLEPLTNREKAILALQNTFGPQAIGNRVLSAGIDQWRDQPSEWPGGMEGYGMRFGYRMGRLAVYNSIHLATDVAFKIDPRYDRCDCTGFRSRAGHAWRRVLVSRADSGQEMPAISNFTASFGAPLVAQTWYPDRLNTWDRKLQSGALALGWRGTTNLIREFWPEIKRGIPLLRGKE